ncbi:jg9045 [Pararge aegeria aegeria]|uniref:Jg9045 protein n=1 Tax=Pararge aegeria aegeria TaxID=348720 RepID=A0A8S4RAB6_9NEOP|nr:jg9045 [Pararge aegeria aegeria]
MFVLNMGAAAPWGALESTEVPRSAPSVLRKNSIHRQHWSRLAACALNPSISYETYGQFPAEGRYWAEDNRDGIYCKTVLARKLEGLTTKATRGKKKKKSKRRENKRRRGGVIGKERGEGNSKKLITVKE